MQAVLEIETLPTGSLDASAAFHANHLEAAKAMLSKAETSALAIVLASAGPDHDDWRRTLARDLARAFTPKRVNVVGGDNTAAKIAMLAYLRDAPGVTGQYLAAHE